MIKYRAVTDHSQRVWERLSAVYKVEQGDTSHIATFRRFCCIKYFVSETEDRFISNRSYLIPHETTESVILMVSGRNEAACEAFAEKMMRKIDELISNNECVYSIVVPRPPEVDDYRITCSSAKCPHARFGKK